MARLSDRFIVSQVNSDLILTDTNNMDEYKFSLINSPNLQSLASTLTQFTAGLGSVESDGRLVAGLSLTDQEFIGLVFWAGYFYAHT